MSCETEPIEALRQAGHKVTPQRVLILRSIRHATGHVTAAEILEEVKRSYPYVDVSTVYRTLSVLKQMRLVSETHMGGGDAIYEWVSAERHHHLVCRVCHAIIELDHHYLESLGTQLRAAHDFQADIDHFAIFGCCANCRM